MPERADDPATLAELNEIQPESIPIPAVPVVITGDVRTQEQPDKLATFTTMSVDTARRIAARDPRRSRVSLWCATAQPVIVGTSLSDVMTGTVTGGAVVALTQALGVVQLEVIDELYANTTTPGTAGIVCIVNEQWSD